MFLGCEVFYRCVRFRLVLVILEGAVSRIKVLMDALGHLVAKSILVLLRLLVEADGRLSCYTKAHVFDDEVVASGLSSHKLVEVRGQIYLPVVT